MDSELVARLLFSPSFRPFDLITVSGREYTVEEAKHCRIIGDQCAALWSRSGDVEFIDLRLVERVRINDTLPFGDFEKLK